MSRGRYTNHYKMIKNKPIRYTQLQYITPTIKKKKKEFPFNIMLFPADLIIFIMCVVLMSIFKNDILHVLCYILFGLQILIKGVDK